MLAAVSAAGAGLFHFFCSFSYFFKVLIGFFGSRVSLVTGPIVVRPASFLHQPFVLSLLCVCLLADLDCCSTAAELVLFWACLGGGNNKITLDIV